MGLTTLQVCMDSSNWLQGGLHEDMNNNNDMDSPSVTDMLTNTVAPQAMMDQRRLRPPHDQALNCPRCDSAHTKFCYYNNYSLSQPRYFCKTCRRYWTKGGTLRNIPVGGGCRKHKKITPVKKSNNTNHINNNEHYSLSNPGSSLSQNPMSSSRGVSELNNMLYGAGGGGGGTQGIGGFGGFSLVGGGQETNNNSLLPINFMEGSRANFGNMVNGGIGQQQNMNVLTTPFGMSYDGGMENYQRLMVPYEGDEHGMMNEEMSYQNGIMDVKPSAKLLSLEDQYHHQNWQEHHNQGCLDAGKDYSLGYHLNGFGAWNGMMNNGF